MFGLFGGIAGLGAILGKEAITKNREQREYENECANRIAQATEKYGKYGEIHHKTFKQYGGSEGKTPYETAKIKAHSIYSRYDYPLTEEEIAAVEEFFWKSTIYEMDMMTAIKYRLDTGVYLEELFLFCPNKPTYAKSFINKKRKREGL